MKIDKRKIIAVIDGNISGESKILNTVCPLTQKIGENIAEFFLKEMSEGRLPKRFLPVQIGVGNVANSLFDVLSSIEEIPHYSMYSELLQDSAINGLLSGKISFASGGALGLSPEHLQIIFDNFDFFRKKLILRPVEITNHPEIIRRLGVIAINTALEADVFGNVNSTHVCGKNIMNGIGGSGDFARNAYLTIFATPSIAKEGNISSIVPFCSHIDHTEHDVHVLVTEQGVADLRGRTPSEKAKIIIENCAHPQYRDLLRGCLDQASGHIPLDLKKAFSFHLRFLEKGNML